MTEHEHREPPTHQEVMQIEADNAAALAQGIEDGTLTLTISPDGTTVLTNNLTGDKRIEGPGGVVVEARRYNGRLGFSYYELSDHKKDEQ